MGVLGFLFVAIVFLTWLFKNCNKFDGPHTF